ncbi:MAG TPA: DUF3866 domain-containing protein [Peptococcaceae bacterium]|nr:MAG: Uncharacterized protein XD50_0916 [Clostridia bacterium 41_269]HBT20464.1 DUF3866 domain-containing protein [Peptococcaceae bacterium]
MIHKKIGKVKAVISRRCGLTEISVDIAGKIYPAINFDNLTGRVQEGDTVLLNTTAVDLNLGSGGYHFVMANLSEPAEKEEKINGLGHIMKLRYTPFQMRVLAAEEQDSPYHELLKEEESLCSTPVVCCTLHSMLPPAAASIKALSPNLRVVYVMTDGAALPIQLSRLVQILKEKNLIQATVTTGHSFGGDLEAVNIYSGLLAAKKVFNADIIIVSMGPGIVGTGTTYGFTGIEQADIINAVKVLEGIPIGVPRISFADRRERHYGLSHHSRTALGKASLSRAVVALPIMDEEKVEKIINQMKESRITEKHIIVLEDGNQGLEFLSENNIKVTTMGRSILEDREFFLAPSAAGSTAVKILMGEKLNLLDINFLDKWGKEDIWKKKELTPEQFIKGE